MNNLHDTPPKGMPAPVISTQGLTKIFGEQVAVQDVNMIIPPGKIFGFIGPSGCGKTTTVRLLLGIYQPTAGEVKVFGHSPAQFSRQDRERLGYMPQLFVLYPTLTVWENLNFAASLYGVPMRRGARLSRLLDLVELEGDKGKRSSNLSGGMQRRLSLAAALVNNPELVFLDEPTAGIDPVLRRKFWDYFTELQQQGKTLFVTTQYVNEAAYCDYVGVMSEGRLLMIETPDGLRRRALGGDMIELSFKEPVTNEIRYTVREMPFVRGDMQMIDRNSARLVVDNASEAMPDLIEWFNNRNIEVVSIREFAPPFDDLFVHLLQREQRKAEEQAFDYA